MAERPGTTFVAANTLFLAGAAALAAAALWPIYQSTQLVIVVFAAISLGCLVAILGAVFRWPAYVVLLATFGAFLLVGVPVAVPGKAVSGVLPTVEGLTDLLSGVALGWKQLLTISLPVGQYQALLVPFFALVLLLTMVSLSVALRGRLGDTAVLGPVVLFVAAILFGPVGGMPPFVLALGLLAVLLLWIVWRRFDRRRTAIRRLATANRGGSRAAMTRDNSVARVRTVLGAALILVLAAGTAVGAATVFPPSGQRQVLRSVTTQPFEPRNYPSPLSGFRTYWQQPVVDSVLLSVRGLPDGARLRLATLDTYDGIVYSVGSGAVDSASGWFRRVPYVVDQSSVRGKKVSIDVTVRDYSGRWVPTVGQLETMSFAGRNATALRDAFYFNDTTGTAADIAGLRNGDSYSLDAVVPRQPSARQFSTLEAGSAPAPVPGLGVMPAELVSVLNRYVSGVDGQGNKLVAMIAALKQHGYVSHGVGPREPASRFGHSADRITELLTGQRMIGDAEQYSVTAALMARELGFPARVVLGFVPEDTRGVKEIRGRDVSAWIEVDTARFGWVALDPNPMVRPIPNEKPEDPARVRRPQSIVPPPVTEPDSSDRQPVPDTVQHDPALLDPFLATVLLIVRVLGWVVLAAAVVLFPFLTVVLAKVGRRRARRRARTSLERISGGWREYEDAVLDHGYAPPRLATRSEVAATVGGAGPAVLAAVADRAVFSPESPDQKEADLVWRSVGELAASLDSGRSRWERIKARVSLRSLGARSRGARSLGGRSPGARSRGAHDWPKRPKP